VPNEQMGGVQPTHLRKTSSLLDEIPSSQSAVDSGGPWTPRRAHANHCIIVS
jgi:hypothetical protein